MFLLISVIYPRKKKDNTFAVSYYKDVASISKEKFVIELDTKNNDYETSMKNQIYINSKICYRKHKLFAIAIWSLIPLITFLMISMFLILFSTNVICIY